MDFDVVIASPDAMRVVGQLGQILGPRGLMPNPKVGTVSPDVVQAVKNAKAGQVQYRTDKAGIVQCTIGRASFTPEQLKTNLVALIEALNKAKPAGREGRLSQEGQSFRRRWARASASTTRLRSAPAPGLTQLTDRIWRDAAGRQRSAADRQRPLERKLNPGGRVGFRGCSDP